MVVESATRNDLYLIGKFDLKVSKVYFVAVNGNELKVAKKNSFTDFTDDTDGRAVLARPAGWVWFGEREMGCGWTRQIGLSAGFPSALRGDELLRGFLSTGFAARGWVPRRYTRGYSPPPRSGRENTSVVGAFGRSRDLVGGVGSKGAGCVALFRCADDRVGLFFMIARRSGACFAGTISLMRIFGGRNSPRGG